ncbi:PQQ-binding-like beta-propeller repeat protein [Streptomyces sp. NPDC090073]|uniref:protein kinase domain-containing protein n=1 Tax=Streptomyces sp. NPDC090073 TaxID=3365936 RepID=UPI003824917F
MQSRATGPARIGPYDVLRRLGSGGMGEVYLAESRTGLRLAVKVVRHEHAEDRTFRARFRHEVRAARTVGGEGTFTARVVDADTEAERPWMATEFVPGPNLRDAVLDHGALPEPAVRVLAAALAEALAAIHAKGLIHRDLKPSNILLAPDGPRVIDFGIVRALEATALTRTGAVVGSVGYVSPEQIRNGGQVGPPSDVFSLGAVLAHAAAGREPFGEGQDSVILLRILTRDFDLSGVPEGVRPLVAACLREDPLERPTPSEVVAAAGFTPGALRGAVRPGWYGPAGAPGPAHDDRPSGVEYLAPAAPAPAEPPRGPAGALPAADAALPAPVEPPLSAAPPDRTPGPAVARPAADAAQPAASASPPAASASPPAASASPPAAAVPDLVPGSAGPAAADPARGLAVARPAADAAQPAASASPPAASASPPAFSASHPAAAVPDLVPGSADPAPAGPPRSAVTPATTVTPGTPASSSSPTTPVVRSLGPVAPGRRRLLKMLAGGSVAAGAGAWLWQRGPDVVGHSAGHDSSLTSTPAAVERRAVLRWQYDVGGIGGLDGPCCALSPDGSVVYVGTSDGVLHAVSRDGSRRWKVRLGDDVSSPVATREGVYCVVGFPAEDERRLTAVSPSGHPLWTRTLGDHGYAVPVLLGDDVLVSFGGTDAGGLRRYAPDGGTRWSAKTPAGPTGTPVVADGLVCTGSYGDVLLALDARDGSRAWQVPAGTDVTAAALSGTTLFADSAAVRQGFRLKDGRRLWRTEAYGSGTMTAGSRSLVIGTEAATVYAVRAADGSRAWSYDVRSATGEPRAVAAGDTVYARSADRLWALDLNGRKRWSATLGHGAGDDQHVPVVRGRRLYVPSGTGIAAVDVSD